MKRTRIEPTPEHYAAARRVWTMLKRDLVLTRTIWPDPTEDAVHAIAQELCRAPPPSRRGSLRKGSTVEGSDTLPANSRRTARGTKEKTR